MIWRRATPEETKAAGVGQGGIVTENIRRRRPNPLRKGRELAALAAGILRGMGFRVETTQMAVRWLPVDKAPPALRHKAVNGLVPMSRRIDFFGIFDLLYVTQDGRTRGGAQVTTATNASARRRKILASGFPVTEHDLLLAYYGRPRRRFLVYRGPAFVESHEEWRPNKRMRGDVG